MSLRYGCFISYSRHPDELTMALIKQLTEAINIHLSQMFPNGIFVDTEEGRPGDVPDITLGQAICRSACMVVVFCPRYQGRPYCQRELKAMLSLEKLRRDRTNGALQGKSLIFPIVYAGEDDDIPDFIKNTDYIDMRGFRLYSKKISRNRELDEKIRNMVYEMWRRIKILRNSEDALSIDCDTYQLPELTEPQTIHPPFPGRPS